MLGISDAVELAKKVGDLVKAGATMGLQETIMELREAILNAKDEVFRLREENHTLQAQVSERAEWAEIASTYTLTKAPGGALVYRTEESPVPHYACPRCFEERRRQILQDRRVMAGTFDCPGCGKSYNVGPPHEFTPVPPASGGGGPHGWMRS
jgi:hypothetical protein